MSAMPCEHYPRQQHYAKEWVLLEQLKLIIGSIHKTLQCLMQQCWSSLLKSENLHVQLWKQSSLLPRQTRNTMAMGMQHSFHTSCFCQFQLFRFKSYLWQPGTVAWRRVELTSFRLCEPAPFYRSMNQRHANFWPSSGMLTFICKDFKKRRQLFCIQFGICNFGANSIQDSILIVLFGTCRPLVIGSSFC